MVVIVAFFGSLIGSFLNVVVYRVPAGISIVRPPSACPQCGSRIRAYDNIPVLSWLLLRGACRDCGARISARYPAVEAGTALFFGVVAFALLGPLQAPGSTFVPTVLTLVAYLYLAAISVALAIIDLETHRLPDRIVLPSTAIFAGVLAVAAVVAGDGGRLGEAAIGAAAMVLFYGLLAFVRPGGMGMGDVKLAGILGFALGWLGWGPLAVGAFAAFLLGGVYGLILIAIGRAKAGSGIPFGPWMLTGTWIGIFFGAPIAAAYLGVIGVR